MHRFMPMAFWKFFTRKNRREADKYTGAALLRFAVAVHFHFEILLLGYQNATGF